MAALQDLRWEIQQQLHQLTSAADTDLLCKLAGSCKDEMEEDWPGEDATNVELFNFTVDFSRSKQLRSLEDQGMTHCSFFVTSLMNCNHHRQLEEVVKHLMKSTLIQWQRLNQK